MFCDRLRPMIFLITELWKSNDPFSAKTARKSRKCNSSCLVLRQADPQASDIGVQWLEAKNDIPVFLAPALCRTKLNYVQQYSKASIALVDAEVWWMEG
jgi:hypothetical protein